MVDHTAPRAIDVCTFVTGGAAGPQSQYSNAATFSSVISVLSRKRAEIAEATDNWRGLQYSSGSDLQYPQFLPLILAGSRIENPTRVVRGRLFDARKCEWAMSRPNHDLTESTRIAECALYTRTPVESPKDV